MNRSAKDGARSSLHYGGGGVLIHPSNQGVCGWHGREIKAVHEIGVHPIVLSRDYTYSQPPASYEQAQAW